jgi:WD40 repeat protein
VADTATGTELFHLNHNDAVNSVAFSPDGTRVAAGSDDGSARLFDAATGSKLSRLGHDGPVYAVAFSPDGECVVGLKAWFAWDFTLEQYPGMNAWVRFTDDAGLHWELTTDLHLGKFDSRDW